MFLKGCPLILSDVNSSNFVWNTSCLLRDVPLKELKNLSRGEAISDALVDERFELLLLL